MGHAFYCRGATRIHLAFISGAHCSLECKAICGGYMMYTIYSKTDDLAISAPEGSTILQATLNAGISHTHVCGGNGRCSTCRVYILEGLEHCLPRNEKERRIAHKLGFPEHIRLACQTKIQGDITIKRAVIDELDIEIIFKQIGDKTGTYFGKEIEIAALFFDIENYTVLRPVIQSQGRHQLRQGHHR